MKHLEPSDFTPKYQPDDADPVSFKLQPLDLKGQYELRSSMGKKGIPSWEGIETASRYIVGWKGAQLGEFSPARVREVVSGGANPNWMIWLGHIAGELWLNSFIEGEAEKKS